MTLLAELKRSVYAAIGAGDRARSTAHRWWSEPEAAWRQVIDGYRDFADHGEEVLGAAQRSTRRGAQEAHRAALRVPGVAPTEGELSGVVSDPGELPLYDYDNRTSADIAATLSSLTQRQLHQVEGYELAHQARRTVLTKIDSLRGDEPWPGYDELTVDEIVPRVRELHGEAREKVLAYERRHRDRSTITEL